MSSSSDTFGPGSNPGGGHIEFLGTFLLRKNSIPVQIIFYIKLKIFIDLTIILHGNNDLGTYDIKRNLLFVKFHQSFLVHYINKDETIFFIVT